MQFLTSVLLAAFVGYLAAWYFGAVEGNFALLLMVATLVTGLYWLAERFVFLPRRRRAAAALDAAMAERDAELARQGIAPVDGRALEERANARQRVLGQPWWLDWTAGLFPVIAMVFVLRSFLFEPFKIPSGSMVPTLVIGDLILVNKFTYGLRLPVFNTKLTAGTPPARGDVMVFRYPKQPSVDYIKRVVGVPGDTVAYLNKRLAINGQAVPSTDAGEYFDDDAMRYFKQFEERLDTHTHRSITDANAPAFVPGVDNFPFRENCSYTVEGVACKVPEGHYFMMGDNRDNSLDSRFWGFVPDANIVGRAFLIWMNFSNPRRVGRFD